MDISGNWYNELGSSMSLEVAADGTVTGRYQAAVGNASGLYPLGGRAEVGGAAADDQNVAFGVSWQNDSGDSQSATAWSGQAQVVDGAEVLQTTWLLTMETAPADYWASTLVGQDTFTRTQPSAEAIEKAKKFGKLSHPALKA